MRDVISRFDRFHSILHAAVGGAWECRLPDGTSISADAFVAARPQTRRVVETVLAYSQVPGAPLVS